MRDDLAFVEQIQRDLRDVRWPEPQDIRAEGRRRSRRTALAATVVLTLAGVSAFVAAERGGEVAPPPVAASASPTAPARAEIALDSLLRPADLAQPAQVQLSESGLGEPVRVERMLGHCRETQGMTTGWQMSLWSRSQTLLRERPEGVDRPSSDLLLSQDLYRVTPDVAASFFGNLDQMLATCPEWRSVGPYTIAGQTGTAEVVHRWAVVQRGFAGDGAVLVRHSSSRARDQKTGETVGNVSRPTSTAVVRVGDLIAVLTPGRDGTEPELIRLAAVAASRMCLAANPPC
ncbi:hypothetical protein JNW91_29925 [Micromonospora sp. STR1_7]|uniref:PknH-like extracellular domain-containing protein n=1 Tax=Micromonospora parastrephiae TaxID=2806101 RepID=A0ABS1Y278_9ACTN|nr:hypothetical protein [Micromonospora parastrephiae]MBM0235618.1 hypothetical protein [Micromonospora parastrephiae]